MSMTEPAILFDHAVSCHLAGDLATAQKGYEVYLQQIQSLPVVRTNLAAIYINQGRFTDAHQLLSLALAEAPDYPEALCNRGYLEVLQGDSDQALPYLEKALLGNPCLVPALTHIIPLLANKGCGHEALDKLGRALEINPALPQLHDLKAQLILNESGPRAAAEYLEVSASHFSGAERATMESARARMLLADATDLPEALKVLEAAIALRSEPCPADLINKGEALRKLSRHNEALEWVNHCLSVHGDLGGLLNLKGCILQDIGQYADAMKLYQLAIEAEPINPLFYANYGFLSSDRGSHGHAITIFRQGLDQFPHDAALHHGMAQAHFHLGKPRTAYSHYQQAVAASPSNLNIWDNFLYFLSFVNIVPGQRILEHCATYATKALAPRLHEREHRKPQQGTSASCRPLKVGIISAEIGSHCVSYFLLSLILGADPESVHFYIFPSKIRSNEPRWQIFEQHAHTFQCIEQCSDSEAADLIRSYELDVVLETTQHMVANRLTLMNQRLAPVQAHYIGMHGTTGVPCIDYFIGDTTITPHEFSGNFSEQLLQLPRTWVCYTPPEQGLPALRETIDSPLLRLGSFNNVSKISRECIRLWSLVLLAIPDSTLLLKDSLRNGELDHQSNLVNYLCRRGIDRERIQIVPRTESWEAHMDLYNDLDIAMDTVPLTSGTTAFDALLMGVPLVAYSSPWIGGRLSASILRGYGQPDWIAENPDHYVGIIQSLSNDIQALRQERQCRRDQFLASELCDQESMASAVVESLRDAYLRTCLHDSGL